eukprot:TRINITY_DN1940_c0_g1_i1.p2 TRINITY_DN1940_c0_g1~~TRINITY_DN1940_c0_g1_i1.p2  ORF type:complete len:104 (+),score=8.19 TRINITY_DN1940_c0_g1_i1:9-320(+)
MYCVYFMFLFFIFFFQAEDGIRDFCLSRGLGDVYKRQLYSQTSSTSSSYFQTFPSQIQWNAFPHILAFSSTNLNSNNGSNLVSLTPSSSSISLRAFNSQLSSF